MPIDGDISAQHFYANDKMFSSFISSCCHLREEISKIRLILILLLSRSDKYADNHCTSSAGLVECLRLVKLFPSPKSETRCGTEGFMGKPTAFAVFLVHHQLCSVQEVKALPPSLPKFFISRKKGGRCQDGWNGGKTNPPRFAGEVPPLLFLPSFLPDSSLRCALLATDNRTAGRVNPMGIIHMR